MQGRNAAGIVRASEHAMVVDVKFSSGAPCDSGRVRACDCPQISRWIICADEHTMVCD